MRLGLQVHHPSWRLMVAVPVPVAVRAAGQAELAAVVARAPEPERRLAPERVQGLEGASVQGSAPGLGPQLRFRRCPACNLVEAKHTCRCLQQKPRELLEVPENTALVKRVQTVATIAAIEYLQRPSWGRRSRPGRRSGGGGGGGGGPRRRRSGRGCRCGRGRRRGRGRGRTPGRRRCRCRRCHRKLVDRSCGCRRWGSCLDGVHLCGGRSSELWC
jgi:hypothetical protein